MYTIKDYIEFYKNNSLEEVHWNEQDILLTAILAYLPIESFQKTKNFAKGNIATHNTIIDYQQRYDDWQSNFVKDSDGKVVMHDVFLFRENLTVFAKQDME